MDRRSFMWTCGGAVACGQAALLGASPVAPLLDAFAPQTPAASIIPVVGDGKYVWNKPPKGQTGYLEPRQYELKIGIELIGRGKNTTNVRATSVAPVAQPEQKIDDFKIETQGCQAVLRRLRPEAGQLLLVTPRIHKGQQVTATATYRLTVYKSYHGYRREQFPRQQLTRQQRFDKEIRKYYLGDSPGIQTNRDEVNHLAAQVGGQFDHPWDKAKAYYQWVWKNIRARIGSYTSVLAALRDRVGDCEERAAVFVALCRASNIPARLVWVPNHNWAEFYLKDAEGTGHWIPAHTSAYNWFGWTGAHEVVLQKGDKISVPEKPGELRLLADWMQWKGLRPKANWTAELRPLSTENSQDAGPGARSKDEKGEWRPVGEHPLDKLLRDGRRIVAAAG